MKKFLKILGIVCLGIVIWYVGLTAFFTLLFGKNNSDSNAETSKTKVEESRANEEMNVSIDFSGDISSAFQENSNEYYDTMQEALLKDTTMNFELEELYRKNIDEMIKKFEGDKYVLIFYRSVKDKKEEAFNFVRFQVREGKNAKKQYRVDTMTGTILKHNSIYLDNAYELVESTLWSSDVVKIGINPDKERFIGGMIREDFFEEGESIYNLEIEGQNPDEIIEYESFGKTWYYWYYSDLKSEKPYNELEFTLKK